MMIGDLLEVLEYKRWKEINEARRAKDRERREEGTRDEPKAPKVKTGRPIINNGSLVEDNSSFIWIKEGEPVYKMESIEVIAQKIRFLLL